jgi:hypothetical protein
MFFPDLSSSVELLGRPDIDIDIIPAQYVSEVEHESLGELGN